MLVKGGYGWPCGEREGVGGHVGEGTIWVNICNVLITLGSRLTTSSAPFLLFLLETKLLM